MNTPDSKAGRVTEDVMARIRRNLPQMETHEYNRCYEAVLEAMQQQFPEQVVDKPRPFAGFYG